MVSGGIIPKAGIEFAFVAFANVLQEMSIELHARLIPVPGKSAMNATELLLQ